MIDPQQLNPYKFKKHRRNWKRPLDPKRIILSVEVNREMFLVDWISGKISSIFVARQSQSGCTIITSSGRRMGTDTLTHKVFHDSASAEAASKHVRGEIKDGGYETLLVTHRISV